MSIQAEEQKLINILSNQTYEFAISCDGSVHWNEYCSSNLRVAEFFETRNLQPVMIRFGQLPANNQSKNHLTSELEEGVSVYDALIDWHSLQVIPLMPSSSSKLFLSNLSTYNGFAWGAVELSRSALHSKTSLDSWRRHCYLIKGERLETAGSDGEPLVKNPRLKQVVVPWHRIAWKQGEESDVGI